MLQTSQMCFLSVVRSTTGTPSGNLKRKIMVQIHFLKLSPQHYPNIKALVTILYTLPVTSSTAERSFSGLKRIKTVLGSRMRNERLSHDSTSKKSLMNIPDVIPGAFNFLTPVDSYLFVVLLHIFLLTSYAN